MVRVFWHGKIFPILDWHIRSRVALSEGISVARDGSQELWLTKTFESDYEVKPFWPKLENNVVQKVDENKQKFLLSFLAKVGKIAAFNKLIPNKIK